MLLALLAIALTADPACARARCDRAERAGGRISVGRALALFEFAPPEGTGMGAECACTTPTGSKGQTVTYTRASSATCMKGNWTSGIANGDLVTCLTNQPTISQRPDGTGPLGIRYEPTRTNVALRSEEFENAAYTNFVGTGGTNPTVTANAAVAPDGTTTADRHQFANSPSPQASMRVQANLGGAGLGACSIFLKGNGTSGTMHLAKYNSGVATFDFAICSYNATTWTRCSTAPVNGATSVGNCYFGNDGAGAFGGTNLGAIDVFLWGLQFEMGTNTSSYLATAGASSARAVDNWSITQATLTTAGVTEADGCAGMDIWQPGPAAVLTVGTGCGVAGGDTGSRLPFVVFSGGTARQVRVFDGANQNSSTALSAGLLYDQVLSLAARWKTGVGINSWSPSIGDGTLQATYNNDIFGSSTVRLGLSGSGCPSNDPLWMTRIRFDTYGKGCR